MKILNGQTCRYRSGWAYPIACCDCGLVHRYDFNIRKGGIIALTVWRDDWTTQKDRKKISTKQIKWLMKQFKYEKKKETKTKG